MTIGGILSLREFGDAYQRQKITRIRRGKLAGGATNCSAIWGGELAQLRGRSAARQ
jgi:hypothetical protein